MTPKPLSKVLGNNIAERRRQLGMTQAQLAEFLDIGQDALSRMENGAISPKISRLREIALALRCNVAELFRELDENAEERSDSLAELLHPLSVKEQERVINLTREIVNLLISKNDLNC